jgi:hypothetical protein
MRMTLLVCTQMVVGHRRGLCSFARSGNCQSRRHHDGGDASLLMPSPRAIGVTKVGVHQFHEKKLTAKVVAPAGELASPVTYVYAHRSRSRTHGKAASHHHRYKHDDVSRMAGRATATGRLVAQYRWQAQRLVADESAAEGFGVQQEFEAEAESIAVRRAYVQAVEASTTGTLCAIQTGSACEDDDAEEDKHLTPPLPLYEF